MYPHRDYYRNESTIRSLPIAIKSPTENSWTSVLINGPTSTTEEFAKEFAPFGLQCVPFEPKRINRRAILKERCAALCSLRLLVLLFHASNLLHYFILPYALVFWHENKWSFYGAYYLGVINDVIFFIYVTASCRARHRCGEWCYNLLLVVPLWLSYEEIVRRHEGIACIVNGFNLGFFLCRCLPAPLRLYWSVQPLKLFRIGEFCPMKFILRLSCYAFLMLHGGVVVWGVVVLIAQPQFTLIYLQNATKPFQLHYGHSLHFVADLMIQNRQPGPIETLPNLFIIGMSLVCFMFSLYVQGCVFLERELQNKRLIKLQHFTNNLKQHLRNRQFNSLVKKVVQNHQNVEVHKKSVALDECQRLLRAVNWSLLQDVLFDLNLPALKAGVILGVKHPSADCYLRYLSSKMQREYYNADETIYASGAVMDKMVVLVDGYLDVLAEDNATSMMSMAPGTCLGQVALLLQMKCKATIRCVTPVRILTLSKKSFLTSTLSTFPDVYRQLSRNFQAQLTDSKTRKRTMMMRPPQYHVSLAETANKQLYKICSIGNSVTRQGAIAFHKSSRIGKVDEDLMLNAGWNIMMVIIGVIVAITYPYYIAFERRFPAGFNFVALPMEILIIVDLVLTLITYEVPKTKQRVFTFNRRFCAKHLWRKLNDWSFYLDFASAIVLEPITYAFNCEEEQAEFLYYLFKLNRIIKVYKLFHLVWSINFGNDFYKRLLLHFLSIALMIYYGAVLLYLVSCFEATCKPNGWLRTLQNYEFATGVKEARTDEKFLCALHSSLLHVHSMDVHLSTDTLDMTISLFMCFLGYMYLSFVTIDLACLRYLQLKLMTYYKVDMDDMRKVTVKVAPSLQRRLLSYYRLQWKYDPGYFYHYNYGNYMTKSLGTQIVLAERLETLMKVPILMSIGKLFCRRLALKSKVYLVAHEDVVTYAGNMNKEMLVLVEGYCQDETGMLIKPLSPTLVAARGQSVQSAQQTEQTDSETRISDLRGQRERNCGAFGMASLLFNLPEEHTITTLTPCLLISIDGSALQEALLHYPRLSDALAHVPRSNAYVAAAKIKLDMPKHSGTVASDRNDDPGGKYGVLLRIRKFFERRSFVNVRAYCQQRGEVYADPFRKEEIDFMKYCMLPVTIDPWGAFFLGWVVLRAAVALILGLTTPLMLICYSNLGFRSRTLFICNVLCDAVIALDCCLLCYLAYPKFNGVIVVHPYRTFGHYGGRGMLIDCLLALPLEWFYRMSHDDARMFALIRLLKLAQVYKYFVILVKLRQLEVHMLRRIIEVIKCISWIAILCNEDSWMRKSPFWQDHGRDDLAPLGPLYTLSFHWSTRLMFGVSFGDLRAQGGHNLLVVVVILALGIFLYGYCLKSIVSYFLATLGQFKDASRFRGYQVMMQNLMKFLRREEQHLPIDTVLKFKDNAIYYWRLTQGINTNKLLSRLHTTVLQDTLCFLYEDTLSQVPLFKSMERAFLRILILIAKPVYFLPQQVVINQEDVCDRFYIILNGVVHVELARSSYRVNISLGSIFGYFSKDTTPVMSIKATTVDHVHVLCFKSIDYFNILKNYAKFDVELKGVLSEYKDFMPNHAEEQQFLLDGVKSDTALTHTGCLQKVKFYKILDEVLTLFAFANALLIPFTVILHHWSLIYILIIVDVLFAFAFALDFVKPYYSDLGLLITDYRVIRKRSLEGKRKVLHLSEVVCLVVILISYAVYYLHALPVGWFFRGAGIPFAYLRVVALYRCRYIGHKSFQDIEDDLFLSKLFRIIMTFLIVLHWLTCIWVLMQQHIASVSVRDVQDILIAYINGLLLMTNLFTGGATIRGYFRAECEQIFISAALALLTLYRYYLVAKAIAWLYLRLKPIVKFNFQLQQLKAYVRTINVNTFQIKHLTKHLIKLEKREMGQNFPVLLTLLPSPLTNELKVLLYQPLLEKSYVFYGTQFNFLRNVAMQLRRSVYFPGEVILHHGEINKCMYFIRDGSVEILSINDNHTETRHDLLQAGEMFGLAQGLFRHNVQHQFTFKALSEVEILTLRLDHWEHLLRHFPISKETIYNRVRNVQR